LGAGKDPGHPPPQRVGWLAGLSRGGKGDFTRGEQEGVRASTTEKASERHPTK